jgi:rare lipoprotein A
MTLRTRAAVPASALLLVLLATAGCAARSDDAHRAHAPEPSSQPLPQPAPATAAPATKPLSVLNGRATYYSDRLAGRPTASGEPYDPGKLTAAHRSLPLGTEVEVARPDGRTVRVRINDRGPFGKAAHRGVIIDLSRRAAEQIGMIRAGVVEVAVRVLSLPPRSTTSGVLGSTRGSARAARPARVRRNR